VLTAIRGVDLSANAPLRANRQRGVAAAARQAGPWLTAETHKERDVESNGCSRDARRDLSKNQSPAGAVGALDGPAHGEGCGAW
jgi:hypothetical protein